MGKTKSCNWSDQNTKNQKTKIWDEWNIGFKYLWPSQNILVRWDLLDFEYNFWSHHRMKGHHHEYWNHPWFKSKSLQILKSQLCHRIWWQYIKIYQTIKNWSFTFYFLRVKPFDSIRPSYLLSCCDIFLAWLPNFNSKSLSTLTYIYILWIKEFAFECQA